MRTSTPIVLAIVTCFALINTATASDSSPTEINLLRLPSAHMERSTASLDDAGSLPALYDDNAATVANIKVSEDATLDVVFAFDNVVTADRLTVQLPNSSTTKRIEILVSTLSPQAGFRSVRGDPLRQATDIQEFRFQPIGARWIMLRVTPSKGHPTIDLADVSVMGREGAPTSSYAFKQTPVAAFEVLARLKSISAVDVSLSPDETSLFADVADGKLDHWTFEEAALIASGVQTAQDRAPYLATLGAMEAGASQAIAAGTNSFDKGRRLLKWLYGVGALKRYSLKQTNLSTLLNTGEYIGSALRGAGKAFRLGRARDRSA